MKKVLIVDDELNMRVVLHAMLKKNGYEVTEAVDGLDALAHLEKESFDVLVTDLKMPKLNGFGAPGGRDCKISRNAGHYHHGARDHRNGRGCPEERGFRLHHQAF